MTPERDIERVLDVWLETGPSVMPDRVYDAVLDRIEHVPQRGTRPFTRRFHPMSSTLKLVAVTVLATAVGLGAFSFLATTSPTIPASSPSPRPSPTPSPELLPLSFAELEPGTYRLGDPTSVPDSPIARMTATVPEGWGGIRGRTFANLFQMTEEPMVGSVGIAIPSNFFVDPCDLSKGRWDPPLGPSVADFVEAIADVPGYTVSEPTEIEWLGYQGKSLEEVGPSSVARCSDGFAHAWETQFNETAEYLVDGQHNRLRVVDIDGTRVVVTLPQSVTAAPTPGTDPASLAEQQQVLDSIRIAPAPSPSGSPSASSGT